MRTLSALLLCAWLSGCRCLQPNQGSVALLDDQRVAMFRVSFEKQLPSGWKILEMHRCPTFWDKAPWPHQMLITFVKDGEFHAGRSAHSACLILPRDYSPSELMLSETGGPIVLTKNYQVYIWGWPYSYGWKSFSSDVAAAIARIEPIMFFVRGRREP